MDDPATSKISEKDITTFQNDGAVCLRGAFDQKWVDLLRKGIETNRLDPSEMTKRKGHSPLFFHDYNNWSSIPEYKEFIFHSRVGEIAARFLQSSVRDSIKDYKVTKEIPFVFLSLGGLEFQPAFVNTRMNLLE